MAGKTAVWLDLAIPVFISAQSELSFSAFSRQTLIGSATMTFEEITQSERDNFGSIIVQKMFRTFDGEVTGSLQVKFRLEREEKNISAVNQDFLFSGDNLNHSVRPNNNSLPPWKTVESIPFVLKVVKIVAIDIVGDSNEKRPLILQVKYLDWLKKTVSNHRSLSSAEWIDNEWCFIIFQLELNLLISVQTSESYEIGTISIAISDILMSPINNEGHIDISGLLFHGSSSTGKITMQMTTAPYISPEEAEKLESEQRLLSAALAKKRTVGYLYIKSVEVKNLTQVYGLFANSPKVTVRVHEWSGSTSVALDGGNNFHWEDMNWGKIPLKEYAMLHVTVTSWNEVIGSFSVQWKDLLICFNADSKHSVVISGDLYNGIVSKGTVELVCLPLVAVDLDANIESEGEVFLDESLDYGQDESFGNGSGVNIESYNTNIIALDNLSVSTSTPVVIYAKVLGISVYKLKSVSSVLKNSPSVTMTCGNWMSNTGSVLFGGESANWILQSNKLWSFKMKGMSFIMVSVQSSSSTLIGSVAVSSRDLVAVKKDDQGLTYITRPIEDSVNITGYVKLCFNIEVSFTDEDTQLHGASSSRPNTTSEKVNKQIKNDERLKVPFTLTVLNITVLDLKVRAYVPAPVSVEIKCGPESNRTKKSLLSYRHEMWTNLDWVFHILDDGMYVFISVLSGSTLVGQIVLTAEDILVSTRTAQGFTELQCIIRNGGKVVGKLRLDVMISAFVTYAKQQRIESKMEQNLQKYLQNLKLVGHMSLKIVSAMEVSLIYTNLVLNVSVGTWSRKSHKAFNQKGHLTWGNFQNEWENIELYDRCNIVIGLETPEESPYTIGRITFSPADLLKLPSDEDGVVVLQGELMDGIVCKAKLSLACKITMIESAKLEGNIERVIIADSTGMVIENKGIGFDLQRCSLVEASATQLAPVHKLGKNSPMLKMEINGLQSRSESIPGGGSVAKWTKLFWDIDMKRTVKIKLSVSSGSALIGAVTLSSKDIVDQCQIEGFDGLVRLKKEVVNRNMVSGELELCFEVPSTGSRQAAVNMFVGGHEEIARSSHYGSEHDQQAMTPLNASMDGSVQFHPDDLVQDSLFSNVTNSKAGQYSEASLVLTPKNVNDDIVSLSERSRSSESNRPKTSRGSENDFIVSIPRDPTGSIMPSADVSHSNSNYTSIARHSAPILPTPIPAIVNDSSIPYSSEPIRSTNDDDGSTLSLSSGMSLTGSIGSGSTAHLSSSQSRSISHRVSGQSIEDYSNSSSFYSGSGGYLDSSSAQSIESYSSSITTSSVVKSNDSRSGTVTYASFPESGSSQSGSTRNSSNIQSVGASSQSSQSQSGSTYSASFPESSSESGSVGNSSTIQSGESQSSLIGSSVQSGRSLSGSITYSTSIPGSGSSQSGSMGNSSSFQSGESQSGSSSSNSSSFPMNESQGGHTSIRSGKYHSRSTSRPESDLESSSVIRDSTAQSEGFQSGTTAISLTVQSSNIPSSDSSPHQSSSSPSGSVGNNVSFQSGVSQSHSSLIGSTLQSGQSQIGYSASFPESESSQSGSMENSSSFQSGESESGSATYNSSFAMDESQIGHSSIQSDEYHSSSSILLSSSLPESESQSGSVTSDSSVQSEAFQSGTTTNTAISSTVKNSSKPSSYDSSSHQSTASQSDSLSNSETTRSGTTAYSSSVQDTESRSYTGSNNYNSSVEEDSGFQSSSTAVSSSEYTSVSVQDSDSISESSIARSSSRSGSVAISSSIQNSRSESFYTSHFSACSVLTDDNTVMESMSVSSGSTRSFMSHEKSSESLVSARSSGSDDDNSQWSTSQSSSYSSEEMEGSLDVDSRIGSTADDVNHDLFESRSVTSSTYTTEYSSTDSKVSLTGTSMLSSADKNVKSSDHSIPTPAVDAAFFSTEYSTLEPSQHLSISDSSNVNTMSNTSFSQLGGVHYEKSFVSHPDSGIFSSDLRKDEIPSDFIPPLLINDADADVDTDGSQTERSVSSYGSFDSSRPSTAASTASSHSYCSSAITDSVATSRSSRSNRSSFGGGDGLDTFRSVNSEHSRYSMQSSFQPKSILKTSQRYRKATTTSYEMANHITFDVRGLRWSPLPSTPLTIVKQFSKSYTHALVYEVVNSLVCLAEGRSYSPSLLNRTVDNLSSIGFPVSVTGDISTRRLLTTVVLTSRRTEIINYHAQIYAEYFLQVGGTNALRKECMVRYEEDTTFRELSEKSFGTTVQVYLIAF